MSVKGKLADIAGQYLTKGKSVFIEGRIQTRKWEGKDGNDRYTTEIVGDKIQMLGGKGDIGKDGESSSGYIDDADAFDPDKSPF